jgi:hypothetical protein
LLPESRKAGKPESRKAGKPERRSLFLTIRSQAMKNKTREDIPKGILLDGWYDLNGNACGRRRRDHPPGIRGMNSWIGDDVCLTVGYSTG